MQIEGKNYYEILGVERNASLEQIRAAYKEIARVYHPDSNFYDEILGEGMAEQNIAIFKVLTAAYHTLSNSEKRKEYDSNLLPNLKSWNDDGNIFDAPMRDRPVGEQRPSSSATRSGAYGIFGVAPEVKPQSAIDRETQREVEFKSGIFLRKITFWEKLKILLGVSKYTHFQ